MLAIVLICTPVSPLALKHPKPKAMRHNNNIRTIIIIIIVVMVIFFPLYHSSLSTKP